MNNRTDDGGDGLLGRWNRRKSAVRRAESRQRPPAEETPPAAPLPEAHNPATTDSPPADAPAAEDKATVAVDESPPLPDIETLDENSDYSAFMSRDVDAGLRRAALRKLFHSPSMNITDGLDDYADDFTNFAPLGDIVTADMRLRSRREAERAAREQAEAAEQTASEATEPAVTDSGGQGADEAQALQDNPEAGTTALRAEPAQAADAGADRHGEHTEPPVKDLPGTQAGALSAPEPVAKDKQKRSEERRTDAARRHGAGDDSIV